MVYNFRNGLGEHEILVSTAMPKFSLDIAWSRLWKFYAVATYSFLIINSIHDPIRAYLLVCWAIGVASGVIWLN